MYYIGLDLGSTACKTIVLAHDKKTLLWQSVCPTGWSSVESGRKIQAELMSAGFDVDKAKVVATGYGRVAVPYATKTVTEISCHARGVQFLFDRDCTVIDIGGQDVKVITLKNGQVEDFIMNDKCSAGTGRFLEVMANTLAVGLPELFALAKRGGGVTISSLCTVFAESEVISLIGSGRSKEDIAYGICESVVSKVASLCKRQAANKLYYLSGGLCESGYLRQRLAQKLGAEVCTTPLARYAGALGAALLASELA